MDVHAPQEPIHSWKDFWIHLGTITAGLLIAIGLEQSVEMVHHMHQRHVLLHDLHHEAVRNQEILKQDIEAADEIAQRYLATRDNVDLVRAAHGKQVALKPLPARSNKLLLMPSEAVWNTARDSQLLPLLPSTVTQMYEDAYLQHDFNLTAANDWLAECTNMVIFGNQISTEAVKAAGNDCDYDLDLTKLTQAQLDEYYQRLTVMMSKTQSMSNIYAYYAIENQALLDGATSEEDLHQRMAKAMNAKAPTAAD